MIKAAQVIGVFIASLLQLTQLARAVGECTVQEYRDCPSTYNNLTLSHCFFGCDCTGAAPAPPTLNASCTLPPTVNASHYFAWWNISSHDHSTMTYDLSLEAAGLSEKGTVKTDVGVTGSKVVSVAGGSESNYFMAHAAYGTAAPAGASSNAGFRAGLLPCSSTVGPMSVSPPSTSSGYVGISISPFLTQSNRGWRYVDFMVEILNGTDVWHTVGNFSGKYSAIDFHTPPQCGSISFRVRSLLNTPDAPPLVCPDISAVISTNSLSSPVSVPHVSSVDVNDTGITMHFDATWDGGCGPMVYSASAIADPKHRIAFGANMTSTEPEGTPLSLHIPTQGCFAEYIIDFSVENGNGHRDASYTTVKGLCSNKKKGISVGEGVGIGVGVVAAVCVIGAAVWWFKRPKSRDEYNSI